VHFLLGEGAECVLWLIRMNTDDTMAVVEFLNIYQVLVYITS